MFERPGSGERAILVHPYIKPDSNPDQLDEFLHLTHSAGVDPLEVISSARTVVDAKYVVGSGKAEEIRQQVEQLQADLVIFNHPLSPAQERNLEKLLKCRVLDRTGLILDIFAQRARSFEGKLQVELAQLSHLSTRLIRGWTHLERQKGGIGLRGPGETQLETDRRLIGRRIKQLKKKLEKVRGQREQSSRVRNRASVPVISLVGYTNAGKSSLFNRLTGAGVHAADQLFATLDPTLRRLQLPGLGPVVIADTVGFIRDLPHELVESFRSTLDETKDASLLIHVIDGYDPQRKEYIEQVEQVLDQIGANTVRQIRVYNKIDQMGIEPRVDRREGKSPRVWLSAQTGEGIDQLMEVLQQELQQDCVHGWLLVPHSMGGIRAQLHEIQSVIDEQCTESGAWLLEIRTAGNMVEGILAQDPSQLKFYAEFPEQLAARALAT